MGAAAWWLLSSHDNRCGRLAVVVEVASSGMSFAGSKRLWVGVLAWLPLVEAVEWASRFDMLVLPVGNCRWRSL